MDLNGKRTVITGAASGIGRATAIAAAGRGAQLFLTDINAEGLAETAEQIGDAVKLAAAFDIADYDAVKTFAADPGGSVDIVMNVAGISTWGAVENLEHKHWQRTIEIDLIGPINVIECFLPEMVRARRGGHLVNVSSAAGLFGLPWHAPYSAAKFGLRGVSEVLRFDLRRHKIGVSLVCPGAVRTPLVGTVDIVGVDRERPQFRKMVKRFERHAVSPERVARQIIAAVEHNRYMVYTSRDIRLGHWVQRKFAWPYEVAMRIANDRMVAVAGAGKRR